VQKSSLALVLAGVVGIGALAAVYLVPTRTPDAPGTGVPDVQAANDTAKGGDPFGYAAAFDRELKKLGQISPKQFADKYPAPAYLGKLTFDPTTAKFFDKMNVEKVKKPGATIERRGGEKYTFPDTEIPGYKLTPDELAKFKANGFVVTERLGGHSFAQVYYDIYQRDLPVFVSADSVLHAWHRTYDAMLEELELSYLRGSLDSMLTKMHDSVAQAQKEYGAGVLADSVKDADYFLAVARSLLADGTVATKLDQGDRLKQTLAAVKAEGMHKFELFGRLREMDFSQFKPRGHYETKPELRTYFKAMMWCGRTDLRVSGGYDKSGPLSSTRELGAAMVLLDLLRKAEKEEAWRKFDSCVQTFVGRTDSATFDDLARIAVKAKVKSPADLKTEADLTALTNAVANSDAGKQDIRGDVYIAPPGGAKVELPRSFTVLGQKFVIDSWVTSKTVFDDIKWNNEFVQRRVPGALDVAFAALGNNHTTPELVARIEGGSHKWRDGKQYQHNLAAVRNVIDGLDAGAWDDTIYMQWLKTLRTLSPAADKDAPEVARTREWAMKNTNTQLASWTQLRHDTILYVKQSYTVGATCYYPAGYVEPVVPFWAAMDNMASRSAALIEQTPFPEMMKPTQAKQVKFLRDFALRMGQLRGIAEKQLAQKELTAAETKLLQDVMQITRVPMGCYSEPRYDGWYPQLFYSGTKDCIKWDALVADVHTDVPAPPIGDSGSVLHQGVGNIDMMLVAIDNGKDRVLYLGPTFSHYEFETPVAQRKTDKEWKADLLDGKVPPRPDHTRGYLIPGKKVEEMNKWQKQRLIDSDD
jgi:hypothetical protein